MIFKQRNKFVTTFCTLVFKLNVNTPYSKRLTIRFCSHLRYQKFTLKILIKRFLFNFILKNLICVLVNVLYYLNVFGGFLELFCFAYITRAASEIPPFPTSYILCPVAFNSGEHYYSNMFLCFYLTSVFVA